MKEASVRAFFLLLVFALLVHTQALAHRVNVFAYVEAGEIVVECSYSKSKRVNHGAVEVQAASSGEILLQGTTDETGLFRFPVPKQARESGSDLRILLRAGEGHQNEWIVEAAEFMNGAAVAVPAVNSPEEQPTAPKDASRAGSQIPTTSGASGLSRAEMEEIVNTALDAKLAPIKRAMLEQAEDGPGMKEIVGGIGWFFGLVGIAAYFKSRSRV
jgi:nickel transport protein